MAPTTRRRNPRGEGARLREPLIDAAIAVMNDTGDLSKVSVRAITRRAGVSPTALYLHFPDRDAIVDAAIDAGFEAFNETILAAGHAESDPRERLCAMGAAYLAFTERQPALYTVIFGMRRPKERLVEHAPSAVDRKAGFAGLISAVSAVVGEDGDVHATAVALWSALHGYATLRAAGMDLGFPPGDAFVRALLGAHAP